MTPAINSGVTVEIIAHPWKEKDINASWQIEWILIETINTPIDSIRNSVGGRWNPLFSGRSLERNIKSTLLPKKPWSEWLSKQDTSFKNTKVILTVPLDLLGGFVWNPFHKIEDITWERTPVMVDTRLQQGVVIGHTSRGAHANSTPHILWLYQNLIGFWDPTSGVPLRKEIAHRLAKQNAPEELQPNNNELRIIIIEMPLGLLSSIVWDVRPGSTVESAQWIL